MTEKLIVFQDKKIRRLLVNDVWFFAIVDVIAALTDSSKPRDYWYRMKKREKESSGAELSTFCRQLKFEAADGKNMQPIVLTPKVFSASFNQFHRPRPNPSSVGWQRSVMSGCRRLKILN